MNHSTFYYSLRLGIDPKNWDLKKMDVLKQFIQEADMNDINLIINSEELNVGHITKEQLQPWLVTTEIFQEELEKEGIHISMNPWTNLLHSDRGRTLSDAFDFETMVDYQGRKATAVACPLDEKFVTYISEIYGEYAKKQPEYLWMDDDYRHFNHGTLDLGCFCEQHMALFNQKLGTNYTQEIFSALVFQAGEPTKERLVYLEQARKEMIHLAASIAKTVRKESKKTKLGLMTSQPEWHGVEGRDWIGLFEALSLEQPKVSRPHLPSYNEIPGLKYIREFNRHVRPVAYMMPEDSQMYPELENYMYSTYAKSNKFTQLQLETVLLVGAKGILFNFYDMMGNGVVQAYEHQHILKESRDLLDYSVQNPIHLHQLQGVHVLYSQDSVYTRQTKTGTLEEMLPREYEWLALLSSFGISTTMLSTENVIETVNCVIAVNDQILRQLTKQEILHLFTNNQILLDGSSVEILFEKQLQHLIGATSYEWLVPHTGLHTYEEWNGQELIEGVEKARMTVMQQTGDLANIYYEESEGHVLTTLYDENGTAVGNGMAISQNKHFILPISYHLRYAWDAQYINYKEKIIKSFLKKTRVDYLIDMPVVQLLREEKRLFITNFTLDDYDKVKIKLTGYDTHSSIDVLCITRKEAIASKFVRQGEIFELNHPLSSFETIIIEML